MTTRTVSFCSPLNPQHPAWHIARLKNMYRRTEGKREGEKKEGRKGRTFSGIEMDESQALFTRSSQSSGGEKERGGHTVAHSEG